MFVPKRLRRFSVVWRAVIAATLVTGLFLLLPPVTVVGRVQDEVLASTNFWYGKLNTEGRQFRFVIEVARASEVDAARKATLVSLDEGGRRFELTDYQEQDGGMAFKLPASRAAFSGTRDEDSGRITGNWQQLGRAWPLEFERFEQRPEELPTEVWEGSLQAGFQSLLMRLRVYRPAEGPAEYYIDSVTQDVGGFMATGEINEQTLTLDIPALRGKFTGQFSADGQVLKGTWTQAVALDLEFKRLPSPVEIPKAGPVRPQHPQPPFPYQVREVKFAGAESAHTLAGTLTLPREGEKFSLAILISGSGPQDRDSTLFDHKPFLVLADWLTRCGISVLRFDERGVGQSTGNFDTATTMDFAADVAAAVEFARTLPEIDPQAIGLIGHSEGGLIAPLVAAEDSQIAWVVMMAGPGVNGEQVLYSQGQLILAAEGGNAEQLAQQQRLQAAMFQAIKETPAEQWSDEVLETWAQRIELKIAPELRDGTEETESEKTSPALSVEEREVLRAAIRNGLKQVSSPWMRFFLTHEPIPVLQRVRCPLLVLQGSTDLQVAPAVNLPPIEAVLQEVGQTHSKIVELPDLNHLFQTCPTGALSNYSRIEETLSPKVLQAIGDWIEQIRSDHATDDGNS